MNNKPNVLIYTDQVLQSSCTFIHEQGEALKKFVPYYAGSRLVNGLPLNLERTIVVNRENVFGKAREIAYKLARYAPDFYNQIKRVQPCLIHAHFGPDGFDALHIAEELDIPLITTFHGHDVTVKDEYALKKGKFRFKRYIRNRSKLQENGAYFIAVSEFVRSKLVEQGYPSNKIIVHYIGVDVERFKPNPSVERHPFVLFVARFVPKKGGQYLIRAMQKVQAQVPEIELVMVGDGNLRSEWISLAKQSLQQFRYLGWQSPEQVKQLMQSAKVFCVPSVVDKQGDTEAFGIVFAEAQACGLPVVSFASGGIPEAVSHGETGFLAPERDVDLLADYILQLCSDNNLWKTFSNNGVTRIRAKYNLAIQTLKLEELYKKII